MNRFARLGLALLGCVAASQGQEQAYRVRPGESIQAALDLAARDPVIKRVIVQAGVYRPETNRLALLWLNARHDGIHLEADGDVTLSAANPAISDPKRKGHPAVVNHVIYIGDGISTNTVVKGFKITGANNFVLLDHARQIEPNNQLPVGLYFFTDGGGVKIFGRSYPTLENLEIFDSFSSPCAGGISIEHCGEKSGPAGAVEIRNCIFRGARARETGSALDLLWGSSARVRNCLFVGNISNTEAGQRGQFTNNGALTVFPDSHIVVENCTFTGNRNGVDDMSSGNRYVNSIFWENTLDAGLPGARYELALADGSGVVGCVIHGPVPDLNKTLPAGKNRSPAGPPDFSTDFTPRSPGYEEIGYRPGR